MQYGDVPHLLREMYKEALEESETEENERYRLALLGLVNAFRTDLDRKAIRFPEPRRISPTVSVQNY